MLVKTKQTATQKGTEHLNWVLQDSADKPVSILPIKTDRIIYGWSFEIFSKSLLWVQSKLLCRLHILYSIWVRKSMYNCFDILYNST